jgi:hypothetical protein
MSYLACLYVACLQGWLDGMKPARPRPQLRLIAGGKL